jgi:transporter family-2 protein
MTNNIYYLLALAAGVALSAQGGINAQLRTVLGNPAIASLVSFFIGALALMIYIVAFQPSSFGSISNLDGASWYKWTGGILGALFVTMVIIIAPRIGSANMVALIVAGQIVSALFFDHFGMLGFAQHSINWGRIIGSVMLIGGVFLIVKN